MPFQHHTITACRSISIRPQNLSAPFYSTSCLVWAATNLPQMKMPLSCVTDCSILVRTNINDDIPVLFKQWLCEEKKAGNWKAFRRQLAGRVNSFRFGWAAGKTWIWSLLPWSYGILCVTFQANGGHDISQQAPITRWLCSRLCSDLGLRGIHRDGSSVQGALCGK